MNDTERILRAIDWAFYLLLAAIGGIGMIEMLAAASMCHR